MHGNKIIRLYFDDSGNRLPDQDEVDRNDGINGFALGGVLVDEEEVLGVNKRHAAFVAKWQLSGPLHSTKLRGLRDQFRFLRNNPQQDAFFAELEEFLLGIPVLGIACVMHRPGYNERYKEAHGPNRWKMCKTAAAILAERAAKYAASQGAQLKILFEQSGRREDRDILEYVRSLKANGMPFDQGNSAPYGSLTADDFKKIVLGEPHRVTKTYGLAQVADLFLYPMIKGGYDETYGPYVRLLERKKIVDCVLESDEVALRGVKYSCFDFKKQKARSDPSLLAACVEADPGALPMA
ncbi:hypothetical protein XI00_01920 [Bradyrhizobium sp. CCBAU 21359]|nr:hypothetical protein [Bradyrhizobium sp. CCBAU 21359]